MADDAPTSGEPFNLDKLKELIELMEKHGLSEVHLRKGSEQWRLRRGGQEPVLVQAAAAPVPVAAAQTPAATPPEAEAVSAPASNLIDIKSPTIGTFYEAPSPEDPPFVDVGSSVSPDTTVCIVEAMKVMNQITADTSGTIAEKLINNGDPVDVGQVLFRVKPN